MSPAGRRAPSLVTGIAAALAAAASAASSPTPDDASRAEAPPLATGVEIQTRGVDGAQITTRLDRLTTRDWQLGPLAVRPFTRATVTGGHVVVRRPGEATAGALPSRAPGATSAAGEPMTAALLRLAEGLAGRELVAFRIDGFTLAAYRAERRQLELRAAEARIEGGEDGVELREIGASTASGQHLEAARLRLRWDPERLDIRGRYRLCEGAACESATDGALALEPASGRLVRAVPAPAAPDPEQREQDGARR